MRKLNFTLLFVLLGFLANAQYNFSVSVTSYITAQPMPNYPVYIVSDTIGTPTPYFSPVLVWTDATGVHYGNLPSMPQGAYYHFETYDSCQGTVTTNPQMYDSNAVSATGLNVCGNNSQLPIDGTVYLMTTTASDGIVYFISKCPDGSGSYILSVVDSTPINSNGTYNLPSFPAMQTGCVLLVKAALNPSNPDYWDYLPTYYGPGVPSLSWANSPFILAGQPSQGIDIYMVYGTNTGGPAFIGGSVLQGANKTTGVGDPLDKRIVILTDANNTPVAYTYSNAAGHFEFPNLAYGTYKLMGDALGKANPALTVTVSTSNASITNVLFEENSDEFVGSLTTAGTAELASGKYQLSLFPNPASQSFSIKGAEQIQGGKSVKVFSMNGSLISSNDFKDGEQVSMQVSHLCAGIYIVELHTAEGNAVLKLVK